MKQLKRFDEIITLNKKDPNVLGFIGFGSMHHTNRLDAYSDIDFFIIVNQHKETFLSSIKWLEVAPVAWWYQETRDGLKVMYEDGIFLEFAVFYLEELAHIPFEHGTIYYLKDGVDKEAFTPKKMPSKEINISHVFNTWLSNLYIGLLRHHRGEYAAAFLMIQVYASHHFLTLLDKNPDDPFVVERRIESRVSADFDALYAGYKHNVRSARYQLSILEKQFDIPDVYQKLFKELMDA